MEVNNCCGDFGITPDIKECSNQKTEPIGFSSFTVGSTVKMEGDSITYKVIQNDSRGLILKPI